MRRLFGLLSAKSRAEAPAAPAAQDVPLPPAPARRTVILHVGPPKTATTSIQTVLWTNQDLLRRNGFLYPAAGRLDPAIGIAQHQLAFSLADRYPPFVGEEGRKPMEEVWPALVDEIARSDAHTVILSSEGFYGLRRPEQIARIAGFLEGHDVKVLAAERDPVAAAKSLYIQAVKASNLCQIDFFTWLERRGARDRLVLDAWAARFGTDALRVVSYDTPAHPDGLVAAALAACDLPEALIARMERGDDRQNIAPRWDHVVRMRRLNTVRDLPRPPRIALYDRLMACRELPDDAGFARILAKVEPIAPPLRAALRTAYSHPLRREEEPGYEAIAARLAELPDTSHLGPGEQLPGRRPGPARKQIRG